MGLLSLIKSSNIEQINTYLINNPGKINKITNFDSYSWQTPLLYAVEYSNITIIKLLLDHGANPNLNVGQRVSPIIRLQMRENKNIYSEIKLLLEYDEHNEYRYKIGILTLCSVEKINLLNTKN